MTVKKMARIIILNRLHRELTLLPIFEEVANMSDAAVLQEFNSIKQKKIAILNKQKDSVYTQESELT